MLSIGWHVSWTGPTHRDVAAALIAAAAGTAASAGHRQTYGRRQCAWVPDTLDLDAAGAAEVRAPIASLPAKTHWPITVRAWRCASQS